VKPFGSASDNTKKPFIMSAKEYHPTAPTTFSNQFYDHYNFMDHKQAKRQQEFCKKEYNLLFKSAKQSMKKNHFASIPDQADIESSLYLEPSCGGILMW
jgi:hypothetical protein